MSKKSLSRAAQWCSRELVWDSSGYSSFISPPKNMLVGELAVIFPFFECVCDAMCPISGVLLPCSLFSQDKLHRTLTRIKCLLKIKQ